MDLVSKQCKTAILGREEDISRLVTYAEQIVTPRTLERQKVENSKKL